VLYGLMQLSFGTHSTGKGNQTFFECECDFGREICYQPTG